MMNQEVCSHETAVIEARRTGQWSDVVREHFNTCSYCREADRAASWMRSLAQYPGARPMPDPDLLWIQSQVLGPETRRKPQWFAGLSLFNQILGGGLLGACAIVLALMSPEMQALLVTVLHKTGGFGPTTTDPLSLALVSLGVATVLTFAVAVVRPLLDEDF
jgi:predicted anti-sigma-YlaC factor YlaD